MSPEEREELRWGSGVPGPWRRDAGHAIRCRCGHLDAEHRNDLAASSPCYRFPCRCTSLDPVARIFREHRTVEEQEDSLD